MPIEAWYESNTTPDGNHSFGPSEIIVPHPEKKMSREELDIYLEDILNSRSDLVEELLQPICQEGHIKVDVVEWQRPDVFVVSADEVVYCGDIDYHSNLKVQLSCNFSKEGFHFFLSDDAILSFNHWLGDDPEEEFVSDFSAESS